jgi:regulator of nonsense transcripts 2
MLHRYFEGLKTHLLREHKALQKREKENKRILELKGELTEERIAANDQAQKAYEKLITNMGTLSDILDEDMPLLPEVEPEVRDPTSSSGVDVSFPMNTPVSESELDPHCLWEDEEIREFYQNITDIKTLVPAIVYERRQLSQSESSDGGQLHSGGDKTQEGSDPPKSEDTAAEDDKEDEQEEGKEGVGVGAEGKEGAEELEIINLEDDEEDPTIDEGGCVH